MQLRKYQHTAHDNVINDLDAVDSTLIVMATGTGKTVTFGHIGNKFADRGRILVLAHRQELIYQARDKIAAITGQIPDIEMGAEYADRPGMYTARSNFVISTIQSQLAGCGAKGRMSRFMPSDFSLVIIDEAHHACAASYRKVLDYYRQNPAIKILGVTATPDRADESALGQVFQRVSFTYEISDGVNDGYLVPISQRCVSVAGLDYSACRTTAGDLNAADLAAVMEYEANLQAIAHPTYELSAGRKTIVFASSVAHGERLTEIFNRHESGCAAFICGKTDDITRKQTLRNFSRGTVRILVNVGVLTEGFDEPTIEVVAIARPTKSRSLYAQMVGRGTRPLPNLVERLEDATDRCEAIRNSAKPSLEVLDFVGNAGRHKLVTTADILGGNYDDDVIELAEKMARDSDEAVDMRRVLDSAQKEIERRRQNAAREADAATRRALVAKANYSVSTIDAFDVLDIRPERERGWHKGRKPSEKQIEMLLRSGISNAAELSFTHASQLINTIIDRRNNEKCSFKQARILKKYGYAPDSSFAQAREIIDALAANGWRKLEAVPAGATEGGSMTAEQLLQDLTGDGVSLHIDGGSLRWNAPPGRMTTTRLAMLRAHKAEIVTMLSEASGGSGVSGRQKPDNPTDTTTAKAPDNPNSELNQRRALYTYAGRRGFPRLTLPTFKREIHEGQAAWRDFARTGGQWELWDAAVLLDEIREVAA